MLLAVPKTKTNRSLPGPLDFGMHYLPVDIKKKTPVLLVL